MVAMEEHTAWLSILSLALLFIFSLLLRSNREKKPNFPPGPSKLPIIGNLHQLGALTQRSLRDLSLKHGPIMLLQLGRVPTIVVSSADMAEEFLKTHDVDFSIRPQLSSAKNLLYNCKDISFSSGGYWRQMKKIVVMELLSKKRVDSIGYLRDEEVSNMVKKIYNSSKDAAINMRELLAAFTISISSRATVGKKYSGGYGKSGIPGLMRETNEVFGAFSFGDYFPALGFLDVLSGVDGKQKNVSKRMDAFLDGVIEEHCKTKKDGHEHKDFLDVLLDVQKHSVLDIPLTMNNIKAVLLDVISGGTETTSSALEWAMTELVKHPEIMKKAQEEVRRVVGGKSKIEDVDIQKMVYLKAIIKETLRLHPVLPLLVPRQCAKNTKIQGYDVPTKARVYINAWAIGRDPEAWERPEEFEPERFINSDRDYKGLDFHYIPFGGGRRGCPGISFAIPEIEITLATLMHLFDWALPKEMNIQDLDMTETPGLASAKNCSLLLVATPHFN